MRQNYGFIPNFTLHLCDLNSSMNSDSMQQLAFSQSTYSCMHCELANQTSSYATRDLKFQYTLYAEIKLRSQVD